MRSRYDHFSSKRKGIYKLYEKSNEKVLSTQKFFEKTSIPGISLISKEKTVWGKVMWIFFFFVTIIMSIYQSWGLIHDYFEYKTYIQSELKSNSTLPLPAITICSHNPVKWRDIQNSTFVRNIENGYAKMLKKLNPTDGTMDSLKKRQLKEWLLLQQMRENSFKKEYDVEDIYFKRKLLIPYVIYHFTVYGNDSQEFFDFIHPFYGTCTTLNSGIKKGIDVTYVDPAEDILIGLFVYSNQDPGFLNRRPGMVLVVHESKTPPVLNSGSVIYIPTGQRVQVEFALREVNLLPAPYRSKCIDNADMTYRHKMAYYKPFNTPYLYSSEACQSSFAQNETIEDPRFRCVNPKIPTFPHQKDDVCFFEGEKLKGLIPNIEIHKRDCPLVCKKYNYAIRYSLKPYSLPKYFEDAFKLRLKEQIDVFGHYDNFKQMIKENVAIIVIVLKTPLYEELKEVPKYSVSSFWGAVGGNISLWTGISVLCLIELFELIIICLKVKRSSHETYQNHRNMAPRKYAYHY